MKSATLKHFNGNEVTIDLPDDILIDTIERTEDSLVFYLKNHKGFSININKLIEKEREKYGMDNVTTVTVIKKEISLNSLKDQIDRYEAIHNREPYLFMNEETSCEITMNFIKYKNITPIDPTNNHYGTKPCELEGCKVFLNPYLKYGEVELR